MNLWVKRIGQLLAMLAVALFFYGCEDETSLLGYKNPNSKFDVRYVEIPLGSSMLLLDPPRTSNYQFTGETNRLLIGQYADDQFGTIASTAYTQYFTNSAAKLPAGATFDSVSLQLRFDFYNYGSSSVSPQTLSVYELAEPLKGENVRQYNAGSELEIKPAVLGNKTFTIDPEEFNKYLEANKDTTITIKIPLESEFGMRIFESAIRFRDGSTAEDSAFIRNTFFESFPGLAVRSDNGDKILGFNPSAATSRIILHYQTPTTDSLEWSLTLGGLIGFTQILADRSGTDLASLTPHNDITDLEKRYIQSGTGIVTKIKLEKFIEFADTIPNIQINSAELIIDNVEESALNLPPVLALRALQDDNHPKLFSRLNSQDVTDRILYKNYLDFDVEQGAQQRTVVVDRDSAFYVRSDQATGTVLVYSKEKNSYRGFIATFLQQLSKSDGKTRYVNFALHPISPKTVNRVVFNPGTIRLKITYTKPTLSTTP